MKPRDRQLAAIRREPTDRISIDAIHVENLDGIACLLNIPLQDVLPYLGIDGRCYAPAYKGAHRFDSDGRLLSDWGTAAVEEYGSNNHYPFHSESTAQEVEKYQWPNPEDYDYESTMNVMRADQASYATRGPYWRPIFCTICSLMGIEDALVAMYEESAVFEAVLERVLAINYSYCKKMIDTCGDSLDILSLGDDFATQRGLMMSPKLWRKYLKPAYEKLFELGRQKGKPIWFHSCGDVSSVLSDLIDIGIDVWETVQLHTLPMTPEQLKKKYGKNLIFFGAVNTQNLPFSSVEAVREEVEHCIRVLGRDGGYICGPDHHIKPDVSPELALTLFETAKGFSW